MKADVTFHVEYDENENHLRISCGKVDGDSLPMPLYMMMLTSLIELQYKINGGKSSVFLPTEISFSGPPPVKITTMGELVEMMGNVPKDLIKKYYDNMASKISPPPVAENSSINEDEKSLH